MKVVVLTGAGISAESGLPTFRDAGGLWEGRRPEEVATPGAFVADPAAVHRFYDQRRAVLDQVQPNAAHRALARLERVLGDGLYLVTQNVDDLHERAGSQRVHHLHGSLRSARCQACGARSPWSGPLVDGPPCPACGRPALRPDVVWFGEVPHGTDDVYTALLDCGLYVSIGTSGTVYPAAMFVDFASANGARTLELNRETTPGGVFDESRRGHATDLVPAWVDELLGAGT